MVAIERAKITEFALTENETETLLTVLTDSDLPAGMLLTNHLDKMTREQAVFSIRNGDAWLAYLKANGGEVYEGAVSDIILLPKVSCRFC